MAEIHPVFDQPGAGFVTLLPGIKFPPPYKEWQKPENARSYTQAQHHKGNVGVLAGNGYIGLDQDDPPAFDGLSLPSTTMWETRPGRLGMRFRVSDDVAGALAAIGKKPDQSQLKLYKDGEPCGEVKLQRTYQVIPPSHKFIDPATGDDVPPGKGTRADYVLLQDTPPAEIRLGALLEGLQAIGITFSSKLENNIVKLEEMGEKARQRRMGSDESRTRRYAEAALQKEAAIMAGTGKGDRNNQLYKSASNMGQLVAAAVLSEADVMLSLSEAAEKTGLDSEGIRKTILSGLANGKTKPRKIPEPEKRQGATGGEPGLKVVSVDEKVGSIGLDPNTGKIAKVVEYENGEGPKIKKLKAFSDCAVFIHTETVSKDETEFIFCGTGAVDKRQVKFTLPAKDLADGRKFKAALINAFGAKNQAGALDFPTVQGITCNPRLVQRIEAPTWNGNIPLLPGLDLADNVEFRLSSKIPAEVRDGDLQAAKEVLRKLLNVHKYAPILAAAVFGSPALARWHKKNRFGLGLWGLTGTLKTSTVLACVGIYGAGYLDEPKLKAGQHGSTVVGAMEIFAAAGFLPQLYDNVKTVNQKDVESYVGMVHAVLEGGEKARGKKDGGLRESRDFSCIPIITGEVRPEEAATSARVLNLNWSRADDKLLTEVQTQAGLLPAIGYHWLRFLADTDFVLGKDFEAFRTKKIEEFAELHYVNPGRLATVQALLIGIWQLLEESPLGDVIKEHTERFKVALDEAIMGQGRTVSDETEVSKFLSALEELLAANPGLLQSIDGKKTIVGSIIGKRMAEGIFLLPAETLNEMAKIRAFTQQPTIDSLTQALNEKGYLIPGDGRHLKYRCRLNGSYPRGWYLKDEACPQKNEVIPPTGTDKTDNSEPNDPTFPLFPAKKKENIFSTKNQENRDRLEHGKEKQENCGNDGNCGTIDSIDRLVDSDFDSKVSGPTSDPTVPSREALVRVCFRTAHFTDYNNAMHDFQEGDEIEVARWRAEAWQKRGIVDIVEASP